MDIKKIKNDRAFFWTNHSKYKLLQYALSPTAVKSVIRRPERTEEGIAPKTTAVMRRRDGKKNKKEIWVMYQKHTTNNQQLTTDKGRIRIISAWIYPGVSPQGKEIFVPEDVWEGIGD